MLHLFQEFLLLLVAVTVLSVVGRWLPVPPPVTLALGGVALSFLPGFERIELDPELFFVIFLPPLLFSDGWLMPIRELLRVRRTVLMLAIGLVLFTIFTVGAVAHWLVPALPWAMALALGAVVSPTDAVAVSAITARLKVSNRLTAILNGESLLNDATGLVAFRFALLAVAAGSISFTQIAGSFLLLAFGGLVVGLVIGYAVGLLRDGLRRIRGADPLSETTLSLMTPFAVYLAATALDVSSVLAVVAAGLYSGWRDPIKMDVETRQTAWTVWEIFLYWLNGFAFLLLGLTGTDVLMAASRHLDTIQLILYPVIISLVAIIGRIAWMYPGAYLPRLLSRRLRERERRPDPREIFVSAWAGMRGAVTLAAALSIPLALPGGEPFPGRDLVIYFALGVVALTLVVQGITLEPLIRWLGLSADENEQKEEAMARVAAVEAGLSRLREPEESVADPNARRALRELIAEYEHRRTILTQDAGSSHGSRAYLAASRDFELMALGAERETIDRLWREGAIPDGIHRPLQIVLDHEEAMLRNCAFE